MVERILEVIHRHHANPLRPNPLRQLRGRAVWRWVVEPVLNGVGNLLGWGVRVGGWPAISAFHTWAFARLTRCPPQFLTPASQRALLQAVQLVGGLRTSRHQGPVIIMATSHPRAGDPPQSLLFELYRQAFILSHRLAEAQGMRGYARLVLAVDSFALEGVPPFAAAIYCGVVHALHLSLDRQPDQQGWWQRHLTVRGSASPLAGFRLLRFLKQPGGIALAWGGAEPQNGRLLYTVREWVRRTGRRWRLSQSVQRQLLDRMVSFLVGPSARSGGVSSSQRQGLVTILRAVGVSSEDIPGTLGSLLSEFQRETPYRERWVATVVGRLLRQGWPVLLIPLRHCQSDGTAHIMTPDGLEGSPRTRVTRCWVGEGHRMQTEPVSDLSAFARGFVQRSFPEDGTP